MTTKHTKQRLIEEGTALFLERGYHDTGIQDLLAAAGVPKGSFYHHFRSKETFGLAVIATYGLLVAVGFGISLRSRDMFRKLLAGGLSFVLGLQTFLIIAGVVRLLPLTGITLPFMSYGGSSLVANFLLLALLARVSHEERT